MRFLILIAFSLGLSACALLDVDRTNYGISGTGSGGAAEFYRQRAQKEFTSAKEELGYYSDRTLTEPEVADVYRRIELRRLERTLNANLDKKQYFTLKPYFANDNERIEFLKIPSWEGRERWSQNRGIASIQNKIEPTAVKLIENSDIAKGMSMEAVMQSWGEPDLRETAGDSLYGNQMWHYRKIVSSQDGYKEEKRVIYFESGRVAGWQTF